MKTKDEQIKSMLKGIDNLQYKLNQLKVGLTKIQSGEIPMTEEQFAQYCANNMMLFEYFGAEYGFDKEKLQ